MKFIFFVISIGTGIVGLLFILLGTIHPVKYREALSENGSAVQVIQVYTEATHTVTVGIGIVTFAVLLAIIGVLFSFKNKKVLNTDGQDDSDGNDSKETLSMAKASRQPFQLL